MWLILQNVIAFYRTRTLFWKGTCSHTLRYNLLVYSITSVISKATNTDIQRIMLREVTGVISFRKMSVQVNGMSSSTTDRLNDTVMLLGARGL